MGWTLLSQEAWADSDQKGCQNSFLAGTRSFWRLATPVVLKSFDYESARLLGVPGETHPRPGLELQSNTHCAGWWRRACDSRQWDRWFVQTRPSLFKNISIIPLWLCYVYRHWTGEMALKNVSECIKQKTFDICFSRQCFLHQVVDKEEVCLWWQPHWQSLWNSRGLWLHGLSGDTATTQEREAFKSSARL